MLNTVLNKMYAYHRSYSTHSTTSFLSMLIFAGIKYLIY